MYGPTRIFWASLTPFSLQHSTKTLVLYAGFTIDTNIGDHVFVYGPDPMLPSDPVWGPTEEIIEGGQTLLTQPRDPKNASRFTGMNNNGASLAYMIAPIQSAARYNLAQGESVILHCH
jgi:hypothetical protein